MGAEVIIFGQSLNSQFLKGLTHSALMMVTLTTPSFACESVTSMDITPSGFSRQKSKSGWTTLKILYHHLLNWPCVHTALKGNYPIVKIPTLLGLGTYFKISATKTQTYLNRICVYAHVYIIIIIIFGRQK